MGNDVDEDLIAATIRRVAAAKAAQGDDDDSEPADLADAGEKKIHAALVPATDDEPPAPDGGANDLIEATIRRVAAEKAAREAKRNADADVPAAPPRMPAPRRSERSEQPAAAAPSTRAPATPPAPVAVASTDALTEIQSSLALTARSLETLVARLDALLPLLERAAQTPAPPAPVVPPARDDDDWEDETPQISRMPVGLPPRPAILRDPSPMTATAEHLVDADVIDTRPLPKPLPPIHVEPKRGFDLLPRSYRITVEDKRRGVDLVPLHRALLSMEGVKDMSLLSYNNGVAIVSLETTGEIDPETLRTFVSRAMSREATVEVHNEHTMVVKLAED
ncbi:MAG TPA: hypothetical protein VIH21_07865 [Dehalococcoidia bacterium]